MKFFKYLILLFLSILSINVIAANYEYRTLDSITSTSWFSSYKDSCQSFVNQKVSNGSNISYVSSTEDQCVYKTSDGNRGAQIEKREATCKAGQNKFLDGFITPSDGSPPDIVCFSGCLYKSDGGGTAFDTPNGNLNWGFNASSTGATCGADTPKGEDKPNPVTPMKPEECKSASGSDAYCNKPSNKQCPTGYKQGSFNNQQICIKPSPDPDPTKPNPNDPNNGDGKGSCNGTNNCNTTNFDDSKIIEAINASTSAITQAISTLSSSLSSGFSSVVNAVSSVTSAVNANTSAVNASGDKVTNAVNENTSAVNAVKSAVNGLNSSIQAVANAVNTNGDKVTNAVNINGKNTVDAVNSNADKVTNAVNTGAKNTIDAVNTSGKNTVDAVNASTDATKENGKKLDGIKDGVDKGNGFLKEIKDWLFADVDQNSFNAETPMRDLQQKDIESDKYKVSGQCPVSRTFSFKGHTFTLDLSNFCYVLEIMGIIVGIAACLHGVAILSENT